MEKQKYSCILAGEQHSEISQVFLYTTEHLYLFESSFVEEVSESQLPFDTVKDTHFLMFFADLPQNIYATTSRIIPMTKINKLVMQGFKSFAKRIELPFSKDFNMVLGANGSGKSNILDGLCFVLGRLSSKDLRTEKLAHLIYNGGKTKQPASRGEVSIFFDNSDKIFPVEESVMKLSRIVRATGQSTYKINDKTIS